MDFINQLLSDIKVELLDEFDRNFEQKAFFDDPWPKNKLTNNRGTMMMRSGDLRRSIASETTIVGNAVKFTSSLPYASIHNEGGQIEVTDAMKRFFWAMYYKASGAAEKGSKQRKLKFTTEADQWKALALKKVGSKITIPKRQFVGDNPRVDQIVRQLVAQNFKDIELEIYQKLKP